MNEKIVQYFFNKGFLLTPKAVGFIEKMNIDYINFNPNTDKLIIDVNDFEKSCDRIEIIKHLTKKPTELSTQDFVKFYTSKYEKMKKIIEKRIEKEMISLNQIKQEGWVIARVRKYKDGFVELEDLTGSKTFQCDQKLAVDDVLCFHINNNKIDEIIYPDVPLREPTKAKGEACFIGDLHLDEAPYDQFEKFLKWFSNTSIKYLFIAGDVSDKEKFEEFVDKYLKNKKIFIIPGHDQQYPSLSNEYNPNNIISLSNPSIIKINDITILLIHQFHKNYIKKRYLGKSKTILSEDFLVMDFIPDIIHFGHDHQPITENYKSITLLNAGSLLTTFIPLVIDFSTRKVQEIKV